MHGKVRLVGGPFGGKVFKDCPQYGQNDLIYTGPKKLSRKQQYDFLSNQMSNSWSHQLPRVEARYTICMDYFGNGAQIVYAPMRHPDGSLFYKYVEGSKREY